MSRYLNSIPPMKNYMKGYRALLVQSATIDITAEGFLLYSLLVSLIALSYKNRTKYSDEDGAFCRCLHKYVNEKLGWSKNKTNRIMKSLEACGIIKIKKEYDRHGIQRGAKVYLKEWHPNLSKEDYPPLDPGKSIASYIALPLELFTNPAFSDMSDRAKLLYCLILDQLGLSEKYERYDREDRLYASYDAAKLAKEMNCSTSSITRAMQELRAAGLAELAQTEYCSEWRVYLRDFREVAKWARNPVNETMEPENMAVEKPIERAVDNLAGEDDAPQNGDAVSSNEGVSLVKNGTAVSSTDAPLMYLENSNSQDTEIAQKKDVQVSSAEIASPRWRALPPVTEEVEQLIRLLVPEEEQQRWLYALALSENELRQTYSTNRRWMSVGGLPKTAEEVRNAYGQIDAATLYVTISKLVPALPKANKPERLVRSYLFSAADYHEAEAKRFGIVHGIHCRGQTISESYAEMDRHNRGRAS